MNDDEMATTTYKVTITLAFSDATTRTINFNGVDEDNLIRVKSKVKALNANMPNSFAQTFVSTIGAPCTMINAAKIVGTTEDVIYSG